MKKITLFIFICLFMAFSAKSQEVKSFFTYLNKTVYFFGIDFSHVKCMGPGFTSGEEIKSTYFSQWNRILVDEGKYDLKSVVRAHTIIPDFTTVDKLNGETDASKIINYTPSFLTVNDITDIVSKYDYSEKTGNAMVFIADTYDWINSKAYVHVAVFDLATHKVMIWEFIQGNPGGMGARNFWSNAISNIIDKIKSDYYPKWESEFVK
jgi:hypothetical protein